MSVQWFIGTEVRLTMSEVSLAAGVGMRRQIMSLFSPDAHGCDGKEGWTLHIEGAGGELAVAKLLNIYWDGSVGTFSNGGDVGRLQVRTRSRLDYELIVRPRDRDEDLFVLVVGRIPVFHVVGWIRGRDARRPEWLAEHGGRPAAHFVPQDALHEMGELRAAMDA